MQEPPPPPDHGPAPLEQDIHIVDDRDRGQFTEPNYEERGPRVQQLFSTLSVNDDPMDDVGPRNERRRSPELPTPSQDYLYYRMTKDGDDWSVAYKSLIPAPLNEIEKKAKKGKGGDGPVLEQMTRMSALRRERIEDVVARANLAETGNARYQVVYIKSKRLLKRSGKIEVPEMDVILAKSKPKPPPRSKSAVREVIQNESKVRVAKEKRDPTDNYQVARRDSGLALLADPIGNLPLFDVDGKPMDEFGPLNLDNAGLPPQVPREKPLGAKPEKKEKGDKGDKRDRSQKRSKSHDRGRINDDDVLVVPEADDYAPDAAADDLYREVKSDKRGRRGKSPRGHPEVEYVDEPGRSHSRRRDARSKSRARRYSTRRYADAGSTSSETSDTSHYGFDYAESSNTSLGTQGGHPRRGTLVHVQDRGDTVYKKHHRGPSRSHSYQEDQVVMVPARSRRNTYVVRERPVDSDRYERGPRYITGVAIPEDRRILYHDGQELVPMRRTSNGRYVPHDLGPVIHHDDEYEYVLREDVERQGSRAEDYQRDRVREDYFKQRDHELNSRERVLELREDDLRRLRRESEYYDDRRDRYASRQLFYDENTGKYFYYYD